MSGSCDWSSIPEDILVTISKKLHSVTDYLRAAQTCKPWRSITLSTYNHPPLPKPPFLLLPEPNPNSKTTEPGLVDDDVEEEEYKRWEEEEEEIPGRGIVGLGDKIWELHLPELHHKRCVGSRGNWLVTVNIEQEISIFNPFTRLQFQLPSQSTLPRSPNEELFNISMKKKKLRDRFISKIVLLSTPQSSNPDSPSEGVLAAVIYGFEPDLAIAKPGDQLWMPQNSTINHYTCVDDLIFFRGKLYFVNGIGNLAFHENFNPPGGGSFPATVVSSFEESRLAAKYYLVEWSGELLLVLKYVSLRSRFPFYETESFRVYKFNFDKVEWDEVNCLGQHSLFLGYSTSVSLLALPDSTFQRNCIYFTPHYQLETTRWCFIEGGRDMGVFDLVDRTIKPHYDGISTASHSPPVWIIPASLS